MREKTIYIEKIGEVLLKKDSRFRRLSLRIGQEKKIWVNIPPGLSFRDGETLVYEQQAWIQKSLTKILLKETKKTLFTSNTSFQTRCHKLRIAGTSASQLSANLNNGVLKVNCPTDLCLESDRAQHFIRDAIVETLRQEGWHYLPKRVMELAHQYKFSFKSVKIRNAKTRWGSCSHENNINLNLHLMRLPQHLVDYVILHELCHTVEKNHSSRFWNLLKKVYPQADNCRKELKNYSLTVF